MGKSNYTDVELIENAKRIIYTYGSIEECTREFNLDTSSIESILSDNYKDLEIRKTISCLLKYPL